MSIKIYNGLKFKSNNLEEILQQLLTIRKLAIPIAAKIGSKLSDLESYISYKEYCKTLTIDSETTIYKIWKEYIKDCSKEFIEHSVPDFKFVIIIYPYKNNYYLTWFGNNKYKELLDPYTTDFHYQNSTDGPDNISEKDWNNRSNIWDKLVKYRFKDTGFTFEVIKESDHEYIDTDRLIQKSFYNSMTSILEAKSYHIKNNKVKIKSKYDNKFYNAFKKMINSKNN